MPFVWNLGLFLRKHNLPCILSLKGGGKCQRKVVSAILCMYYTLQNPWIGTASDVSAWVRRPRYEIID